MNLTLKTSTATLAALLMLSTLTAWGLAPGAPSIFIQVSPESKTIPPGGSGNITVSVTPQEGFEGDVRLNVTTPPTGIDVTFSPNPLKLQAFTTANSSMKVSVGSNVPTGTVTLKIVAVGVANAKVNKTANVTIVVGGTTTSTTTSTNTTTTTSTNTTSTTTNSTTTSKTNTTSTLTNTTSTTTTSTTNTTLTTSSTSNTTSTTTNSTSTTRNTTTTTSPFYTSNTTSTISNTTSTTAAGGVAGLSAELTYAAIGIIVIIIIAAIAIAASRRR
ncbi:MAG: hypothetical protein M1503_09140 [Thaumarchaeota archaeon]|nr:hypothetical protein [Nitrososphaerota archaeon]MCL5318402.1 hypothetical protein [Nitrososphaerota archaeon]